MIQQREQASMRDDPSTVRSAAGALQEELELWVAVQSDAGTVRDLNEDYADCFVPVDEGQRRDKGAIFLLADGMGGHQAGEVASRMAVERVMQEYYADTAHLIGDSLVRALRVANKVLYDHAFSDPSKAGMGTTMVAAVVLGRQVYVANVGDSRAYLLSDHSLSQITQDHSWVEEQVQAGLLTRGQAQKHHQRNLITRALGAKLSVEVDLFRGELRDGDEILLCSDGLCGVLSSQQMASIAYSQPPPQAAAQLIGQAKAQQAEDNVSVVIVKAVKPRRQAEASRASDGLETEDARATMASDIGLSRGKPVAAVRAWLHAAGDQGGWLAGRRRWLLLAAAALLLAGCVCVALAAFPALGQKLAGDPVAAPELAPIRYGDSALDNPDWWAGYLGYASVEQLAAALGAQSSVPADLWPARPGVFIVGLAEDWECQAITCTFQLAMAGEEYEVRLEQPFLAPDSTSLSLQRVRVFGLQEREGETVSARLIDLGSPWWAWWRPAWVTVYHDHTWEESVWVYGVADRNPYSPVELEDYALLERGDRILVHGKWLEGESGDAMCFEVDGLYRLEGTGYAPASGQPTPAPQPTVTLRPSGE